MAIQELTLWLLNRVVGWGPEYFIAHLNAKFRARVGRRVRTGGAARPNPDAIEIPVNEGEDGADGELMHEGRSLPAGTRTAYDEYFMPIPLKCVGELGTQFWKSVASNEGLDRLAELGDHLARRFPAAKPFDRARARATIGPLFGDVRMNFTDKSLGYYQLLQRATEKTGRQNVLIGYSQGGTVARYLAFLDEHVARPERRCIHSVITVQSPNRGSPVAAKAKEGDVGRALVGILLALPGWLPPGDFRSTAIWSFIAGHEKSSSLIAFVNGLLDAELQTWPDEEKTRPLRERWISARKWASGLAGIEDLAFWDLDPARMSEVGSVLHAIASWPLESIQHGAVIGTDNRMDDLLDSATYDANWFVKIGVGAVGDKIARFVPQAEDIYKRDAISFPPGTPGTVADEYDNGIKAGVHKLDDELPKGAHDFVIPSASQLLVPASSPCHRGNLVNRNASHLSGARLSSIEDVVNDAVLVGKLIDRLLPGPGFTIEEPRADMG